MHVRALNEIKKQRNSYALPKIPQKQKVPIFYFGKIAKTAVFCIAVKKVTFGNTEIPRPLPQVPTSGQIVNLIKSNDVMPGRHVRSSQKIAKAGVTGRPAQHTHLQMRFM